MPAAGRARPRYALAPIALAGALIAGIGIADAAPRAEGLSLSQPRFRIIIAARPAGGYFTLTNATDTPQELVEAASPGCGMLMLHRSMETHGVGHMMDVESVTVPAHGKVTFAPGGYHLMCMSPTAEMKPGASVPVTLKFKDGSTLTEAFAVQGVSRK